MLNTNGKYLYFLASLPEIFQTI